jgi:hypothetical protein
MQVNKDLGLMEAAYVIERLKICKAFNNRGAVNGPNVRRFGRQDSVTKRWSWSLASLIVEARRRESVTEAEIQSVVKESAAKKTTPTPIANENWCWEGNVRNCIVEFLKSGGFEITAYANTQARESGKDIRAIAHDGAVLWVTVKGYPQKSSHTQARHWFAGALFDVIMYKEEDSTARLGIGLPAGFTTYHNLAERLIWFKANRSISVLLGT